MRPSEERDDILSITGFDPESERGVESVLAIANGYTGTRGSLEEGAEKSWPATFISGMLDPILTGPGPPDGPDETPALVLAPNWLGLTLFVEDERLSLDLGRVLEHERRRDFRTGWVTRRWRHQLPSGRVTRVTTLRCASIADRHALIQRAWIEPENYDGQLRLVAALELCRPEGMSGLRWPEPVEGAPHGILLLRAPRAGTLLATAQACMLAEDGRPLRAAQRSERQPTRLAEQWLWQAERGRMYVFDRVVTTFDSRGVPEPGTRSAEHLAKLRSSGSERLLKAHRRFWGGLWSAADVQVTGDTTLQQGLRFAVATMLSAADPENERASISTRDLAGASYRGHFMWDAEVYLLPFFTFTWPAAARAMLMYRYHTLDAARAKAAQMGYRGALYAWESGASGHEATPAWDRGPAGERVPMYTWLRSHHISADVAYAVWQYWQATGDEEFFLQAGAEMILETARFWASRARCEADGGYHIRETMGPDEYHEDVDDSAYVNWMARWNLETGRETAHLLRQHHPARWNELGGGLGLGEDEPDHWLEVAGGLVLRCDPEQELIEQFDGYFQLDDIDLGAERGKSTELQSRLGRERTAQTQAIKQADVVLLSHLLGDRLEPTVVARSFDYYEPRCSHESSLSFSIHALMAARLGKEAAARHYLHQAATLDLDGNIGQAARGVHIANCGGLWQAMVFGVAGLRLRADGLELDPRLLGHWQAVCFPLQWRGRRLRIELNSARPEVAVRLEAGEPMRLYLASGNAATIQAGKRYVARRHDEGWERWQAEHAGRPVEQ